MVVEVVVDGGVGVQGDRDRGPGSLASEVVPAKSVQVAHQAGVLLSLVGDPVGSPMGVETNGVVVGPIVAFGKHSIPRSLDAPKASVLEHVLEGVVGVVAISEREVVGVVFGSGARSTLVVGVLVVLALLEVFLCYERLIEDGLRIPFAAPLPVLTGLTSKMAADMCLY